MLREILLPLVFSEGPSTVQTWTEIKPLPHHYPQPLVFGPPRSLVLQTTPIPCFVFLSPSDLSVPPETGGSLSPQHNESPGRNPVSRIKHRGGSNPRLQRSLVRTHPRTDTIIKISIIEGCRKCKRLFVLCPKEVRSQTKDKSKEETPSRLESGNFLRPIKRLLTLLLVDFYTGFWSSSL